MEPEQGVLKHGPLAGKRQKLLGQERPGQRPEPGTRASAQHYRVKHINTFSREMRPNPLPQFMIQLEFMAVEVRQYRVASRRQIENQF
jgi:hypothetical protein